MNSLLAMLNARQSLREQMVGTAVTLPLGSPPIHGGQAASEQVGPP